MDIWRVIAQGAQIITALCGVVALFFTGFQYRKNSKVSKEGIKPLLSVGPIAGTISGKGDYFKTRIQIVNYSGFDAYNVTFDLRYRTGPTADWIREWVTADNNSTELEMKLNVKNPAPFFIKSGQTIEADLTGALDFEKTVCQSETKRLPVEIWTRWYSEKGNRFEKREVWQLLCTKVRDGRSITFEPPLSDNN